MDYETLCENLLFWSENDSFSPRARNALKQASTAITELFGKVEQLEKENAELLKRAEQAERERDAAVSDIESIMAYGGKVNTCHYCRNGQCYERGGTKPCLPRWYQREE